jgi:hypothetical protein
MTDAILQQAVTNYGIKILQDLSVALLQYKPNSTIEAHNLLRRAVSEQKFIDTPNETIYIGEVGKGTLYNVLTIYENDPVMNSLIQSNHTICVTVAKLLTRYINQTADGEWAIYIQGDAILDRLTD